ncbi:MAG: hypothetical protein ACYS8X_02355 [Planctomycetota bacterium]|jgi:hypothetical protein
MSKKKDSSTLFELITRQREKTPQGLKRPAWIDAGHEFAEGEPEEVVAAPTAELPADIEPITDIEPVADLEPYAEVEAPPAVEPVEEPPAIEPVEEPAVEAAVEEAPEPQVEDIPKTGKRKAKAKKAPKRRKKAKAARKAPIEFDEEVPGPEETAEIIEVPVAEPIEAVEPEAEVVPDETPEVEGAAEVVEPEAEEVAEVAEPEADLPPEFRLPFAPHPEPVVEASFAEAFPAAEQPAAPTPFPTPIDEDVVPFAIKIGVVIGFVVAFFFIGRLSITTPKPQPPAEPIIIKTDNGPIRPEPPVEEVDTASTETVGSTETSEIDTTETTTTDTTDTATTDTTTDTTADTTTDTTDTTDTITDQPVEPARLDGKYYLVIESLYDNSPRSNEEAQRMVAFCARNGHEASVQLFSDPDGRRYWAVWSLRPFASETGRDSLGYAHTIEALGRDYSREYRTEYKFSQRYPADSPTLDPLFVRCVAKTSDESHTDDME